jgi:hypothetical protein
MCYVDDGYDMELYRAKIILTAEVNTVNLRNSIIEYLSHFARKIFLRHINFLDH